MTRHHRFTTTVLGCLLFLAAALSGNGQDAKNVTATEHLQQTEQGIFRDRFNGQEPSLPICLLRYPVKLGAKWASEFKIGNDVGDYACETQEEAVEVPAGKFKAIRVKMKVNVNGQKITSTFWFGRDVGMVKQQAEIARARKQ